MSGKKNREELPMEVIYDTFKIPVPISPLGPMEVSLTPPLPKIPASQKLLIPKILQPQKVVRWESIRKK